MKVAELFVELGFVVKGEDKLKGFEASLISAADAAKSLVASLAQLAGLKLPQQGTASSTTPAQTVTPSTGVPPKPGNEAFIGPLPLSAKQEKAFAKQEKALDKSNKSFGVFAKQLLGLGSLAIILKQLGSALVAATKAAIKTSFATDKFGKATGLSRDELLKWQYAADKSDVSPESIRDNLSNLAQRAFEMKYLGQHQEAASLLTGWGLDMQQSPDKLLEQFGKRFANSSLNEALMIAKVAGISPDVAYMMHANKGTIPTRPPGEGLNVEQQTALMEFGKDINNFWTRIGALTNKAIAELTISFTDLFKSISFSSGLLYGNLPTLSAFNAQAVATPALPAQINSGQRNETNNNVTNNILIPGASDKKGIAQEIVDASYQASKNIGP